MFDSDEWRRLPKVGRQHVKVMKNSLGEGYVLRIATRTEDGHTFGPQIGPVFITTKEAHWYKTNYVYFGSNPKGGFKPLENQEYPNLAICRHVSYRNHEDICIEPGCQYAAYQEVK